VGVAICYPRHRSLPVEAFGEDWERSVAIYLLIYLN
jgi:hypothetical protein